MAAAFADPQVGTVSWVIEIHGAERRFGSQRALEPIDLRVGRGEIFGVLGPDSAGKTTLMQMLAAILDPDRGTCRVLGFDTVREAAQVTARIGYMSQGFTLYDRLSVEENLAFAAQVRGIPEHEYRKRRRELLNMAGLSRFSARAAGQLSGGMRKKLALCANLIHEPPLLLLDEPSLGVDPVSRRELWRMLRAYRERGSTIVLTTPYMDEAQQCDRLGFLFSGRLLAVDTPQALAARARGTLYELRTPDATAAYGMLAGSKSVLAVQWWADRLRFQTASEDGLERELRVALDRFGAPRQVEPDLESAFVGLSGGAGLVRDWAAPWTAAVASARPSAVSTRDVTVRFGSFTAVDGVSMHIAPGEVVGWLGPNGAGKTTLIRVLCGLLRPVSGTVQVAGVDVQDRPALLKQHIGYMSQRFSLYPDLTVAENLVFFGGVYGLARRARAEAIEEIMRTTGLEGTGSRRAGQLSGALRQRLALACAILHRPQVLFLDEPTSGVDPMARQRFWALIRSLAASGMAVLVTTHYLEEARFCHRLGLMAQGRLLALGTVEELRAGLADEVPPENDLEAVFMAYMDRERAFAGEIP